MRLVENWKRALNENFQIGTVLKDLSKDFDCIPHDLLISNLHAYGLSQNTIAFFYSCLKRREQRVKLDDILSSLDILISAVLPISILSRIIFKIFVNDLLEVLKKSNIYNIENENTILVASKKETLLENLKNECQLAVNWFRNNNVIVRQDKF